MHESRSLSPKFIGKESIIMFIRRSIISDSQCALSQSVSIFINSVSSSFETFAQNAIISFIIQI